MRHLVCLGLFLAGVFLSGCKGPPRSGGNAPPVPPLPGERSPGQRKEDTFGPAGPVKRTAGATGLLAGVVLDRFDRKMGNATILLYSPGEGEAAPVKIWTDKDGYFTIPNLEVGASYRLTAVIDEGDRKLTGTTFARPPDPRLLIRVSEDLVTPDTPDVPRVPALKEPEKSKPPQQQQGEKKPAARLEIPRTRSQSDAGSQPLDRPNRPRRDLSRTLDIPRPATGSTSQAAPIKLDLTGGARAPRSAPSEVPTPIPSCLMDGNRLLNLALFDDNGQGWEWKKDRRGRLVLLDFWYTECRPCLSAIPKLNQLQQRYGSAGLEVIGIACERADTPAEMARKVQLARRQFDIRYRTLLSTGARKGICPVCSHFGVEYYPTLYLIDDQGNVVYRSVGWNPELEREIQRRLP